MSGHSKFANIKHKKEKNDAKKGKIFTVIGREIVMAVKAGGPDPNNNSKLRDVIAKAKANNMPNDTIDRGIKKAAGADSADSYERAVYEGYGPNGVAIIVETLTDNKNRTAGNVRSAFTKGNGAIGTQGCVSFMFDQKGQIIIDKEECEMDADDLMMLALDAGAEDLSEEEDSFEVLTDPDDFTQKQTFVSYYLSNGNYLKLSNLTLGYNVPPRRISTSRVHASMLLPTMCLPSPATTVWIRSFLTATPSTRVSTSATSILPFIPIHSVLT